ncbi:MAG TPA: FAD-binding oxidoreductase [Bryobacteraceae bacterium]|jgi:glycolate oxidase FAD binding subunit|nr:FAD-binding oxidoreductase [Bryobacteraceae bacterium]
MNVLTPQNPEELAAAMEAAASRGQTIELCGRSSKRRMAGPIAPSDVTISTTACNRVVQYEPQDLTISVEAGLSWCELTRMLAANSQMIPLDPPFSDTATVGGVVAANCSGPRRRLYGTARDVVIGVRFATLEGKLVQSGGMVVKNVAGLDMGKLLIGSFGTLAAIAVVNFKLMPRPTHERTFLLPFDTAAEAMGVRQAIQKSVMQPEALDVLNPAAAAMAGRDGWLLALQVGGNGPAIERYTREVAAWGSGATLDGPEESAFWRNIQDFVPRFLDTHPEGAVGRVSCTLKEVPGVMDSTTAPLVARAGSGVVYGHFANADEAVEWTAAAAARGSRAVVEFAPEDRKDQLELWPSPGNDFDLMTRIKHLLDPDRLLNRGRLYRRI